MRMTFVVAAAAILFAAHAHIAMAEGSAPVSATAGVPSAGIMERLEALRDGRYVVPECRPQEYPMSTPVPTEVVSMTTEVAGCQSGDANDA